MSLINNKVLDMRHPAGYKSSCQPEEDWPGPGGFNTPPFRLRGPCTFKEKTMEWYWVWALFMLGGAAIGILTGIICREAK